jgi:hypothetical protein
MKTHATFFAPAFALPLFVCALVDSSAAATVIGNATIDRGTTDSYSGQVFLLNANLSSLVGQRVTSWSFFNNQTTTSVTPVLAEDMGGGIFAIRGIGTSIVSNASGAQSGAFGLVSGTDMISPNYYAGYYDGSWDGSIASPNPGAVEFDTIDDPPVAGQIDSIGTIWLHGIPDGSDNPANIAVGALNNSDTNFGNAVIGRHYSVNFTAVPEPAASVFGALAGIGLLRRRRFTVC